MFHASADLELDPTWGFWSDGVTERLLPPCP
jgi:hypothetical protein